MTKSAPKCRITRRITNTKRHTKAFIIDGRTVSVSGAVKLAKAGRLNRVHIVGNHVQTLPQRKQKLLDLPIKIVK